MECFLLSDLSAFLKNNKMLKVYPSKYTKEKRADMIGLSIETRQNNY